MAKVLFKGFMQVSQTAFEAKTDEQKLNYLWFVRPDGAEDDSEGDIYLGTRHYGHWSESELGVLAQVIKSAGFQSLTGDYVPYTGGTYTSGVTSVLAATSALDDAVKANKVFEGDGITVTDSATGATIEIKVKSGDKVLATDASGLSATISLAKVDTGHTDPDFAAQYKLVGLNGEQLGDTINIPKDQFLVDVDYEAVIDQSVMDRFQLPGASGDYTDNPYLCFLWELDRDPSTSGSQVGMAVSLKDIIPEPENIVIELNGNEYTKTTGATGSTYSLTVDASDIDIATGITADNTAVYGADIPSGSTIQQALAAIYSSSLLYIDGDDVETA